jgi:hypothetical protein
VHAMSRRARDMHRGAVYVCKEEAVHVVELCVHVMSRRARDVQRRAAMYGMSRVRGNDSCGEQRGEGSSACR